MTHFSDNVIRYYLKQYCAILIDNTLSRIFTQKMNQMELNFNYSNFLVCENVLQWTQFHFLH